MGLSVLKENLLWVPSLDEIPPKVEEPQTTQHSSFIVQVSYDYIIICIFTHLVSNIPCPHQVDHKL